MLALRTVNHPFLLILTSSSLPYKKDNVDTTTKRNQKIEQYINLEFFFENKWPKQSVTTYNKAQ